MNGWRETTPRLAGQWGQVTYHNPTSADLEAQLVRACEAMREWNGDADLPSNTLLALQRDRENRLLIAQHRELATLIGERVLDFHLRGPLLRDCVTACRCYSAAQLLGLDRDRWHPSTPEAGNVDSSGRSGCKRLRTGSCEGTSYADPSDL